jgi:integrase/recombinase XerD
MPTFSDHLLGKGQSTRTVATMVQALGYFMTWCDQQGMEPEECGYRDLLAYVQSLRKREVKAVTVQRYMGAVVHFFAWQVILGRREDNPARAIDIHGIQRRTLHVILSKQELERIYQQHAERKAAPPVWKGIEARNEELALKRDRVALGLLVFQGVTSQELEALQVKDMELRAGKVHVPGGRRHNARTLTLEAAQVMDLMEYTLTVRPQLLALHGKTTEALIVTSGSSHELSNMLFKLTKAVKTIEPKVKTLHQLRASVITHWLKTLNLREAQQRAGHRYVSSTEAYLINDLEDLAEDVARFHPIG